MLVASNGWAYNEMDLAKLKATGTCEGCDLSGAILSDLNLGGANLRGADFTDARLRHIDLDGAIYCKTKIRRKERNDHCEDAD